MYSAHRKLCSGFGEARKVATHTYKGERDQRIPQLEIRKRKKKGKEKKSSATHNNL